MIKRLIPQEDIIIINIYVPKNRTPKYMKQNLTELRREIDNSTIIVGDFNTVLSIMDEITRQKVKKETNPTIVE